VTVATSSDVEIATFTVTDAYMVDISSGNENSHFYIMYDYASTASLYVSASYPLDYESATSHTLTIEASDMEGNSASGSLTVNVTDMAEATMTGLPAPEFDQASWSTSLPEHPTMGTAGVVTVSALYADSYQITAGNGDGLFAIDSYGTLTLTDPESLDFETASTHNLTVQATNSQGTDTSSVTVTVQDVEFTTTDSFGFGVEGGMFSFYLTATGGDPYGYEVDVEDDGFYDLSSFEHDPLIDGVLLLDALSVDLLGGDNGTFTGSLRVLDSGGGSEIYDLDVIIGNVLPSISIDGTLNPGVSDPFSLTLSTSDPGHDTISGLTIAWGDGTSDSPTSFSGAFSHAYAAAGEYTVTATYTDEDGSYSASWDVGVGALDEPQTAPAVSIPSADWYGTDGSTITLTATAEDAFGSIITHGVSGTYEWELNGDNAFDDAVGETVTVTVPFVVQVRVTDYSGNSNEAQFSTESIDPYYAMFGGFYPDPETNPFIGQGTIAGQPTINNYRKNFIDLTPDMKSTHGANWQVHHTLQVGRVTLPNGKTVGVLADRFLNEKGINVHDLTHLRGVPSSVHSEITGLQKSWWNQKMKENNWATIQEAWQKIDLDEVEQFANDLDGQFNKKWMQAGAQQKTVMRRINDSIKQGRGAWTLGRDARRGAVGLSVLGGFLFFQEAHARAGQMANIAGGGGNAEWVTLAAEYDNLYNEIDTIGAMKKESVIDWKNALMAYWGSLGENSDTIAKTSGILERLIRQNQDNFIE